jgi:hypothetical protein
MSNSTLVFLLVVLTLFVGYVFLPASESTSLLKLTLPGEVKSPPVYFDETAVMILNEKKLARITASGVVEKVIDIPAPNRFPLIKTDEEVVILDRARILRGYSRHDLRQLWERELLEIPDLAPIAFQGNRILVRAGPSSLFSLNSATGEPQMEARLRGTLIQLATDKVLGCVYGLADAKQPHWRISGVDPDDGEIMWSFPEPVSDDLPLSHQGHFVFCTSRGVPVAVDQMTGEERFRLEKGGLKMVTIVANTLVMLAAGGSRLECLSLTEGTSWSATLPSPLEVCLGDNKNLFIIDTKGIRCVAADTGLIKWQKDLGKTFNAHVVPQGVGVTYKENFVERETYYAFFNPENGLVKWQVTDRGIFWMPNFSSRGHTLVCRTGTYRVMGKAAAGSAGVTPPDVASGTPKPSLTPTQSFPDVFQKLRQSLATEPPLLGDPTKNKAKTGATQASETSVWE